MMVRIGALAASVCLLGACSTWGGDGRDHDPANQPAYEQPGGSPTQTSHTVHGSAAADTSAAIFELVNGSDVVRVSVADLGDDLFRVSTPDNAKVAPSVDVSGTDVVTALNNTGLAGPAVVNVQLSNDVRWTVRLAGGATDEAVDLTGGKGGDVDFATGTSRAAVALPAASGTQRVVMSGGASQFAVRLAGTAPVRVAANGGAGAVTVDGETHSGVGGGSVWTPTDWPTATNRYDVDATAGVSTLTVSRS
jgi:hypothetical protein